MQTTLCLTIALIVLALTGCVGPPGLGDRRQPQQATSLLDQRLYPMELSPNEKAVRQRDVEQARAAYTFRTDAAEEEAIIWLGRRQAYLGRYDRAIETFSDGLKTYPDSHRLLRHRGHRYITVRRFDLALADLERAAGLVEVRVIPDEVEPDGQPNELNRPRSTSHTNIYYHLGLARYLVGDYDGARDAYERCLRWCENDDMLVATLYWLCLTMLRQGETGPDADILGPVTAEMDIIENDDYQHLLLLFKGEAAVEDLIDPETAEAIQSATVGYGVARWHLAAGRDVEGLAILEQMVLEQAWPAFGHIAAEADLARRHTRIQAEAVHNAGDAPSVFAR